MSNPSPEPTNPGRTVIGGDYNDDDANVLNSLVESDAEPPTGHALPTAPLPDKVAPKPITRLMTGSVAVLAGWAPVLLLPADPNRISLQVWAASATNTDYARISDDPGKIQTVGGSALLYSGQLLDLPEAHTGPVWVFAPDGTGPVTVTFLAVSK